VKLKIVLAANGFEKNLRQDSGSVSTITPDYFAHELLRSCAIA
jgi:hypothetical protein